MEAVRAIEAARARVAVLSLHTSPLDQPGTGDSGGMNVYVRALSERLADRGVAVDVFTRCSGRGVPQVEEMSPLVRVIQVQAGPCAPVAKEDLPTHLPQFTGGVMGGGEGRYDLVHAHYWLSGSAGRAVKRAWDVPLVASFHTLGKVKNLALADAPEPPRRLGGEHAVVRDADLILAPTPAEAAHLVRLYGAGPERLRLVPPGVDLERFRPGPGPEARRRLGLDGRRMILFVGRLQRLKGPDVAIRAFAEAARRRPDLFDEAVLVLMGGPSGPGRPGAEMARLERLAREVGVAGRVRFVPPVPHQELPAFYAAADVVVMPSRSESFGLVALEAQSCGVPVVASAVGGLPYVVADGQTGFLVPPGDHQAFADRLVLLLGHPGLRARLSGAARRHASRFSWERTADLVHSVYGELVPALAGPGALAGA
ncbi:MAG: D-inositol-3-phosphate glycosyltransferase [Actinomycetota bacterium]